jgi:hypothetical protein
MACGSEIYVCEHQNGRYSQPITSIPELNPSWVMLKSAMTVLTLLVVASFPSARHCINHGRLAKTADDGHRSQSGDSVLDASSESLGHLRTVSRGYHAQCGSVPSVRTRFRFDQFLPC